MYIFFFFSSRRRHTRWNCDWSSDVCSSDLVVLGAGGSARAVVDAFRPDVTVVNRTRARGEQLAREMGVKAGGLEALARADVVVNCTTVGMNGDEVPLDPASLRGTVVDL